MKVKFVSLIILMVWIFSNCKEDNKSPSSILTSRIWKTGLIDKNPSTTPSFATGYYVRNCEKDDTFQFGLDGNLVLNRNTDQCDQSELKIETQAYTLNRTTKEFIINGITYTLAEESETQIKYYAPYPGTSGVEYRLHILQ